MSSETNNMSARLLLDMALLQCASESYLDQSDEFDPNGIPLGLVLKAGSNNPSFLKDGDTIDKGVLGGATRMTETQFAYFNANFRIVAHYPNDVSGFSGTLFQSKKDPSKYFISFRSTEYRFDADGGNWSGDGKPGADGEIADIGFATAQLASMEQFYAMLKQGKTWDIASGQWVANASVQQFANGIADGSASLTATGYSLGAHLATSFSLVHQSELAHTYTFNAAGVKAGENFNDRLDSCCESVSENRELA